MTDKEIYKKKQLIIADVKQKHLHNTFSQLTNWAEELGDWQLTDEIKRLEESYLMMLRYALEGVEDPSRQDVFNGIIASIYRCVDRMARKSLKNDSSSKVYFSTLRLLEMQRVGNIGQLIERYTHSLSQSSLYNLITDSSQNTTNRRDASINNERLESDIFNRVWTTYPLSVDDTSAIEQALQSQALPSHFKQLLISALLLGALDYYEDARLKLLLSAYQQEDKTLALTALCAAMIIMSRHHSRINNPRIVNQLKSLAEMPSWHKDVTTAFLQLIRTRDTERVSRKMQDELLPEMMKFRPDTTGKFNIDKLSDIDINSLEENPEWQEMLENSGIGEKMKELTEMQQDGSDVFMSTFAHLKSYSFFSTVSNWFLPFHIDHTEVVDAMGHDSVFAELIASSPHLCNSDKYSFALSLKSVPESQRSMMMSQLDSQNINVAELRNASLSAATQQHENIINKYVQDLYRFFHLYRAKDDFPNPFKSLSNLIDIPVLKHNLKDTETLSIVAEFYFKRKYYNEAYNTFSLVAENSRPHAALFQKMGYSLQQMGNTAKAISLYEQAELLNAESQWTIRNLAACHKTLGQFGEALKYYQRLETMRPDDVSIALNIGHCYLALDNIKEALHNYYKAEFLDEQSTRAWRPVAWCLMLNRDFDQSLAYYNRIINNEPTAADYLNLGHLHLASSQATKAIDAYKQSIAAEGSSIDTFINGIKNDESTLLSLGVNAEMISFIIDAVQYASKQ